MFHQTWLLAFGATLSVEMFLAWLWSGANRCAFPWLEVLTVNLITHPLAFWLACNDAPFIPLELAVILVEALAYHLMLKQSWSPVVTLSLLTNAATMALSYVPRTF